jgi:membrane-bound lytic murein transglycosylase B
VRRAGGGDLPDRDLDAALVPPEQTGGPAFLIYDNYRSILRYNCAHLYGLTVGMLADAISRP